CGKGCGRDDYLHNAEGFTHPSLENRSTLGDYSLLMRQALRKHLSEMPDYSRLEARGVNAEGFRRPTIDMMPKTYANAQHFILDVRCRSRLGATTRRPSSALVSSGRKRPGA